MIAKLKNLRDQILTDNSDTMCRLKKGNSKLSKKVLIFDLPAVRSCLNSKQCKGTCYAVKNQRWPNVMNWRNTNYILAKNHSKELELLINNQLEKACNIIAVRIHSSGDFFNQEYINMWYRIAKNNPLKRFYAYTKVDNILDLDKLSSLHNVNIITSFIDNHLNYGNDDYVNHLKDKHNAFICPSVHNTVVCGEACNYCLTNNKPAFKIH